MSGFPSFFAFANNETSFSKSDSTYGKRLLLTIKMIPSINSFACLQPTLSFKHFYSMIENKKKHSKPVDLRFLHHSFLDRNLFVRFLALLVIDPVCMCAIHFSHFLHDKSHDFAEIGYVLCMFLLEHTYQIFNRLLLN